MCIIYDLVLFQMDDRFFKDLEASFTPQKRIHTSNVLNLIKINNTFESYALLRNINVLVGSHVCIFRHGVQHLRYAMHAVSFNP